MTKKLLEVAADIVQTQASTGHMTSEEIVSSLRNVFKALQDMQRSELEGTALELGGMGAEAVSEEIPAEKADPRQSIKEDKVICLECGTEMRQLTGKHLSIHGLTIREYKQKWGFPTGQSLSAKALSRARSKAAKKRGLPENLVKYQEQRRQKKEAAEAEATAAATAEEKAPAAATTKPGRKKKER